MNDDAKWQLARRRFPVLERLTYLDSGSFGIQCDAVARSQQDYIRLVSELGPTSNQASRFWESGKLPKSLADSYGNLGHWKGIESLRRACGELVLDSDGDCLLWCENTTSAFKTLMSFLKWDWGDQLVTTDLEHDSILNVCEMLYQARGLKTEQAKVRALVGEPDFAERFRNRLVSNITEHTRVVLFSHVFFSCGLVVNPGAIVDAVRGENSEVVVVVDGAHSVGQLPVHVRTYGCDAYLTSGSKWLLAPAGTGILYVARWGRTERIWPTGVYEASPNMLNKAERTLDYLGGGAQHPVLGVTPPVSLVGLGAAIAEYLSLGPDEVSARIQALAERGTEILKSVRGVCLRPRASLETGMLFLENDAWDVNDVLDVARRLREAGVVVGTVASPPSLRVCPHYFNTEADLTRLAERLDVLATV